MPEAVADHAPTVSVLAPFALVTLAAPLAPPRLRELPRVPAHAPIPPLLLKSVLLI